MQKADKKVICLVEPGWEGIRRLTIVLANAGIRSLCIIKSKLKKEVLEMITEYNEISLKSIKRWKFKVYIVLMFLKNFLLKNTICIVMDNKKNYSWVSAINKALGIKTILLVEKGRDYMFFLNNQQKDITYILNLAKELR